MPPGVRPVWRTLVGHIGRARLKEVHGPEPRLSAGDGYRSSGIADSRRGRSRCDLLRYGGGVRPLPQRGGRGRSAGPCARPGRNRHQVRFYLRRRQQAADPQQSPRAHPLGGRRFSQALEDRRDRFAIPAPG
ncbi:hypothetical protein G6F65_021955 [Rhizopus arrhizus]|nr:hypothetical protein G6F65_021955 [Rhizopus arrhizus]